MFLLGLSLGAQGESLEDLASHEQPAFLLEELFIGLESMWLKRPRRYELGSQNYVLANINISSSECLYMVFAKTCTMAQRSHGQLSSSSSVKNPVFIRSSNEHPTCWVKSVQAVV